MKKIFLLALVSALAVHGEAFAEEECAREETHTYFYGTGSLCYNAQGQLIKEVYNKNDGEDSTSVHTYDASGDRVSSTTEFYRDGVIFQKHEKNYVSNGLTDNATYYYYTDGVLREKQYTVYNGHGGQNEEGSYSEKYDENGNPTEYSEVYHGYNPDCEEKWADIYATYYNYDDNGDRRFNYGVYTIFSDDGETQTTTYQYRDSEGNITSERGSVYNCASSPYISYGVWNSQCNLTENFTIIYDGAGNKIQKTTYDSNWNVVSVYPYTEDGDHESNDAQGNNLDQYAENGLYESNSAQVDDLSQYNADSSESVRLAKRIYTVPEAVEASSKKKRNTFSIRHR